VPPLGAGKKKGWCPALSGQDRKGGGGLRKLASRKELLFLEKKRRNPPQKETQSKGELSEILLNEKQPIPTRQNYKNSETGRVFFPTCIARKGKKKEGGEEN